MKKYADIQDINDFELIEDLLKNIIKTSSLKNIETISIAKDALTVLRKLKLRFDTTWTVEDTASYLGCSKKTVYRMIKNGTLKAIKDGKYFFVFETSIVKIKNKKKKKEHTVSLEMLDTLGLIKGGTNNEK